MTRVLYEEVLYLVQDKGVGTVRFHSNGRIQRKTSVLVFSKSMYVGTILTTEWNPKSASKSLNLHKRYLFLQSIPTYICTECLAPTTAHRRGLARM